MISLNVMFMMMLSGAPVIILLLNCFSGDGANS